MSNVHAKNNVCLTSAICWQLFTYLIWMAWSRLIRSKNESKPTLCVLDTCLLFGLWLCNDFFDRGFVVFEDIERDACMQEMCAFGVTRSKLPNKQVCPTCFLDLRWPGHCCGSARTNGSNTSMTVSHKLSTAIPSTRRPAFIENISASVLLCETDVSYLHDHEIGTRVWLPDVHTCPPDVDLEVSAWYPAKICILIYS